MDLSALADLETRIEGAPEGIHLRPESTNDLVRILKTATEEGTAVRIWGGGTVQKMGNPPPEGYVVSMAGLGDVEVWEPDDLTVVVGAGIRVDDLEKMLVGQMQTAVLPERPGDSTLGGVLATARAPLRRTRLLGPRERVLEATVVTGDGRVVRSGGRVVKNVSGFDLHKASVGAFGSLGVIVQLCLKLWPVAESAATIRVESAASVSQLRRPLAVLETREGVAVFVSGTSQDVAHTLATLGGDATEGLQWPEDPGGPFKWSLRVPPSEMSTAISRLGSWDFLAIHGSGEIRLSSDDAVGAEPLRRWAEQVGGALVLVDHPGDIPPLDPWGSLPPAFGLQTRLIGEFDPARIINPGRLPGGM